MESRCHLGEVIRYDTVGQLKWGVSLSNHPIRVIIDSIFGADWGEGDTVPKPRKAAELEGEDGVCVVSHYLPSTFEIVSLIQRFKDCFNWEFGEFKNATKGRWKR